MYSIIVRTQFDFAHRYENATGDFHYLKNLHRHKFFVEIEVEVGHDDREIEFLALKKEIDKYISQCCDGKWKDTMSCEMMCKELFKQIVHLYGLDRKISISIFEDNENGGKMTHVPDNDRYK